MRSIFQPNLFANKTAIVTGGGTGIGKFIATELAFLGCKVLIASRNADRLRLARREMMEKLTSLKKDSPAPEVVDLPCNIRKDEDVKNMTAFAIEKFGGIDFLVNNGGGQFKSPIENISLKGWNAVVETNLTGYWRVTMEVFRQWMKQHGGNVVNITMQNTSGFGYMGHSSAARAAIANLTKTIALEWAHYGVRINCIAPGFIYSPTAMSNYGADGEKLFMDSLKSVPLKRLGTPEEISSSVLFLLSPAANYVTGQEWFVNGGIDLTSQFVYRVPDHDKNEPFTWDGRKMPKGSVK